MSAFDLTTRRATREDLDALVPLFDRYRQFYEQPSDLALARSFLGERLENGDAAIFVAELGGVVIAFTQLYPLFSSTRAQRIFLLNDLFVAPDARKCGAGAALLDAAKVFAQGEGAARLTLSTAHDNVTAQSVYEANGWTRDMHFYVYNFPLKD
jgi:ribosomal protein S18 acetylase RimI-like enzyme